MRLFGTARVHARVHDSRGNQRVHIGSGRAGAARVWSRNRSGRGNPFNTLFGRMALISLVVLLPCRPAGSR